VHKIRYFVGWVPRYFGPLPFMYSFAQFAASGTSDEAIGLTIAPIYGRLYGMQKTTVYIPSDVKLALGKVAMARGLSEAEVIRQALRAVTAEIVPPRPRVPLFKSGKPRLAEQIDKALAGFGET
jgi:hypothetical protein